MISWVKGRVLDIDENEVTINTGNIGYRVFMGENRLLQMSVQKDADVELVIYTVVREDEIKLFGFDSFNSRKIFEILLGVNGVGPKAAIGIVDHLEPQQIIDAVHHGDHSPFLSVSGIGKKTAQRIVLDLQGKIEKLQASPENINTSLNPSANEGLTVKPVQLINDAKSALSNLGFPERDAERVVRNHLNSVKDLDELIRKSLADLQQSV